MKAEWQPIETAPKGKRAVLDLWCIGLRDEIEFYCPDYCATGTMEGDEHLYQGRVTNVQWRDGAWRPKHGLRLHALTVTPLFWMRVPAPPSRRSTARNGHAGDLGTDTPRNGSGGIERGHHE